MPVVFFFAELVKTFLLTVWEEHLSPYIRFGTRPVLKDSKTTQLWSRLLIHPRGVEGAHDFLENSANMDLILQAKGEPGQAQVPTPTIETNKQTNIRNDKNSERECSFRNYFTQ